MSRQQVDSLAAWQLGSLAAWLSNTCSLSAWQLDCLAAQLYNKCSLTAWKLGSVALQQFVACLAGWITADINSPIFSIIPKVWIKGLDQLPWKGLDRGSGSEVWIVCGTGAWSRPYILSRSHICLSVFACKHDTKFKSTKKYLESFQKYYALLTFAPTGLAITVSIQVLESLAVPMTLDGPRIMGFFGGGGSHGRGPLLLYLPYGFSMMPLQNSRVPSFPWPKFLPGS